MSSLYSIGAMNQLADKLEKAGFTSNDVTLLKQYKKLQDFKDVLHKRAEIKIIKHIIDCDADPYVPDGLKKVEMHQKGGQFEWNPRKIKLYLTNKQQNGKHVSGYFIHKELIDMPVINANVLDYLLANPNLIPDNWKDKYIFFWGTIYRNLGGNLCVRYLKWFGDKCGSNFHWFSLSWYDNDPAALLAS